MDTHCVKKQGWLGCVSLHEIGEKKGDIKKNLQLTLHLQSSKKIKMSSYDVYRKCCNDVKIVTKGKINIVYFPWCLFFTGSPLLVATGNTACCCGISPSRVDQNVICFQILCGFV